MTNKDTNVKAMTYVLQAIHFLENEANYAPEHLSIRVDNNDCVIYISMSEGAFSFSYVFSSDLILQAMDSELCVRTGLSTNFYKLAGDVQALLYDEVKRIWED